jgi:transcriptional regulator with XRE-family HTH domain
MTLRYRELGPLAERLANLRRHRAHLRRGELAEQAGVSADLVASLEQGRLANPTLRTLARLARALGVPLAELVAGAEEWCEGRGGLRVVRYQYQPTQRRTLAGRAKPSVEAGRPSQGPRRSTGAD